MNRARHRSRRFTTLIIGTVAMALALVGCASESASTSAKAFNDADVEFSSGMIGHHRQAVEMAEMVIARGVTPEVKALAGRSKTAQSPEITALSGFLTTFGEPIPSAAGGHGAGGGHTGPGIMSPQEMERLGMLSGRELEKAFLIDMVVHHEGAVEMATAEIDEGKDARAKALALAIKTAQVAEIAEMKALLKQYP